MAEPSVAKLLEHVFWIGGPSDAGKTTVTNVLLQRHRWQWYPCDLHEYNHLFARADPVLHPTNYAAIGRSIDESWLHPTARQLFEYVLASNEERFPLICHDLSLMPHHPPVLAEGPRLFPKLVEPVLTSVHQAIWLLPSEAFVHTSQEKRDKPVVRFNSSDPERFRENFLGREGLLWEYINQEVRQRGLPYIEIDGGRDVEAIADEIEAHFAGYITYRK